MKEEIANYARNLQKNKEKLLKAFIEFVDKNGIRPAAKVLEIHPGSLSKYHKGKPISIEKLSEYIIKISNYESREDNK